MSCTINFGRFIIRSLTDTEKDTTIPQLVRNLQKTGTRLASINELSGPSQKWIRVYYPSEHCILAMYDDGSTQKLCLWSPFYTTAINHVGIGLDCAVSRCGMFRQATDIAVVELD